MFVHFMEIRIYDIKDGKRKMCKMYFFRIRSSRVIWQFNKMSYAPYIPSQYRVVCSRIIEQQVL